MGNVHMEATQINYRGGSKKMSVEDAFKAVADELDSLKSGFTTLDDEVNGDATVYPYSDVITIEDAVPSNLADCSVKIEPVQSGSGDPSPTNVRPITGHTEVTVTVTDDAESPTVTKTYTIALGDTIYGGTVDFDSGVMTVDRAIVDLGDLTWLHEGADSVFWANDLSPVRKLLSTDAICSAYEVYNQEVALIANAPSGKVSFQTDNNARVIIKDLSYNDSAAFTAAVTGQKLCYELATPTTIQLTPQQIQLLKGTNTLTASTGDISVTVNGVSGAIGAVQEQVNDIAEDVADIEDDVTAINNSIGWSGEFICMYNSQYELTTIGVTDNDGLTGLQIRDSGIISLYVAGTKIWSAQLTIS